MVRKTKTRQNLILHQNFTKFQKKVNTTKIKNCIVCNSRFHFIPTEMFFEILLVQIKWNYFCRNLNLWTQKGSILVMNTCNIWMIINILKPTYTSNVVVASANGHHSLWTMIKSLGGSEIYPSAFLEKREPQPRHFFFGYSSASLHR